jgi:hypothetical protein
VTGDRCYTPLIWDFIRFLGVRSSPLLNPTPAFGTGEACPVRASSGPGGGWFPDVSGRTLGGVLRTYAVAAPPRHPQKQQLHNWLSVMTLRTADSKA